MNDQARFLAALAAERRAHQSPTRGRTLAVAGGMSGVGTTTLAVNLAVALGQGGTRAVLVDAGSGVGGAARLLGLSPRQTLRQVLDGAATLAGITLEADCGARLLPASACLDDLGNLSPWQEARLASGLAELGRAADLVLVDAGSGPTANLLDVLGVASEIILVATPRADAVTGAYALIKLLAQRGAVPLVHVVVNQVYVRSEGTATASRIAEVAERFLGVRVNSLGCVPADPEVERAGQQGRVVVAAAQRGAAGWALAGIARQLDRPAAGAANAPVADALRQLSALRAQRQAAALAAGAS